MNNSQCPRNPWDSQNHVSTELKDIKNWLKTVFGIVEAARIRGNRIRELNKIQSEAYKEVEEIRGLADPKATEIYALEYNKNPLSIELFEFTRTMQAYPVIISENATLVLSTNNDLFQFLNGINKQ
ncbi:hypothetical protein [Marinicella sp. W31]|uniref:hypothetical protein n=1 Tax=Marinicella sp. W31 TaxID=3023713 RepID=UPI00375688B9